MYKINIQSLTLYGTVLLYSSPQLPAQACIVGHNFKFKYRGREKEQDDDAWLHFVKAKLF
jgi:hypothetical protein